MRKPKIIHIITRLIVGGAENDTIITISELIKQGYEAFLLSGPPKNKEGSLVLEAKRRGIKFQLVPFLVREISPVKDLLALFFILRILLKEKPKIVHTHCSKAGIIGRWAALLAGIPIIVHTPHGHIYSPGRFNFGVIRTSLLLYLERLTTCFTDRIFAVTDIEKREILNFGITRKREKIIVVHSGVEIEKYRDVCVDVSKKKASFGLYKEAEVVGTVGRLVPLKGHCYFLSCIPKVLSAFPTTARCYCATVTRLAEGDACVPYYSAKPPAPIFLFVGDGELRLELEEQAARLGVERNVIFTGLRRDVPEILKCLDVLVLSSTHEAMGKVLVEAMACGLPIVATKVGGVPRVVSDGVTGILVKPASPSALADAIIKLLKDKKLAKEMGEHGKIRATAFSAEAMVKDIINTYLSLLKSAEGVVESHGFAEAKPVCSSASHRKVSKNGNSNHSNRRHGTNKRKSVYRSKKRGTSLPLLYL